VIFFTALMLALGDEPLISSLDKALFVIEAFAASAAWQLTLAGEGPAAQEALRVGPHSDGTVGERADRSACASSCTWGVSVGAN
jgi:hypothetical protein